MFWKENSGRQPQLIILENEGGDETNCPSPPPNFTFFDDPDVPFGPQGPPPPAPGPPEPPLGWPPAPSPVGDRERVRTGDTPRERWHPRSPPPEPQLFPLSDGADDQPPQRRETTGTVQVA